MDRQGRRPAALSRTREKVHDLSKLGTAGWLHPAPRSISHGAHGLLELVAGGLPEVIFGRAAAIPVAPFRTTATPRMRKSPNRRPPTASRGRRRGTGKAPARSRSGSTRRLGYEGLWPWRTR